MPDTAHLQDAARSAYERGRALMALRAAPVAVFLAVLCGRETGEWRRCTAVGTVLLAVTIAARWRLPRGRRSVDAGLLTGAMPMVAALVLCRFARAAPGDAALAVCASFGFVSGAIAGRVTAGTPQWATASLVAGLTAALGCIGIGFGTAIGGTAAVAAGAIVSSQLPRRASA